MKKFKGIMIMILAVLPMIYTAIAVFFILPDTVAAHFGIDGTPDRYGSKFEAFLFPAIILGIAVFYFFICYFFIFKNLPENFNRDPLRRITTVPHGISTFWIR